MSIKLTGVHLVKFVKKANMWCETWFELNKDKFTQKQQWTAEDPRK